MGNQVQEQQPTYGGNSLLPYYGASSTGSDRVVGWGGSSISPTSPNIVPTTAPNINPISNYSAAVTQQAGDYDSIMQNYRTLFNAPAPQRYTGFTPLSYTPVSYTPASYSRGSAFNTAFNNAQNFVNTGGFSGSELDDIRARGISPIRSVYANAQQNLNRQRSLQGGYSPNYTATSAKMARELSNLLSDKVTDVNGMIAGLLQQGRLAGLSAQTPLAGQENSLLNQIAMQNASGANQTNQFNTANQTGVNQFNQTMPFQIYQANSQAEADAFLRQLQATQGMQSLYGTTPALTSLFGNQALSAEQLSSQAMQDYLRGLISQT